MTQPTPRILSCPNCGTRVKFSAKNPSRPFCSERCRLLDLGEWASESHRIAGNPEQDDVLSGDLDALRD